MIKFHFYLHIVEAKHMILESDYLGSHTSSAALPWMITMVDDMTSLGHSFLICNVKITRVWPLWDCWEDIWDRLYKECGQDWASVGLDCVDLSTGKIKLRADVEQRVMLCCFIWYCKDRTQLEAETCWWEDECSGGTLIIVLSLLS